MRMTNVCVRWTGIVAIALAAACGGDDNEDNNGGGGAGGLIGGGGGGDAEENCRDVYAAVARCEDDLSCGPLNSEQQFVSSCVNGDPTPTASDVQAFEQASCAQLNDALCNGGGGGIGRGDTCPSGTTCEDLGDGYGCIAGRDGNNIELPPGTDTCTSSNPCSSGFGCAIPSGESQGYCIQICEPASGGNATLSQVRSLAIARPAAQ